MGKPRELTDSERQKLAADGYRLVEVWVPDIWSERVWEAVLEDCREIRDAQEDADVNLFLEAGLAETLRLIDEMESRSA
jgi:hypothetical protein